MLIKVPHNIYIEDDRLDLSIKYSYNTGDKCYLWSIYYDGVGHNYTFQSQSLIEVQYQALDWIRKEKIQYE